MNYNLKNKVILITGASKGIGKSISTKLAQNGAKVVLLSRSIKELKKVHEELKSAGLQSIYKQTDVSNIDDLKCAVDYTIETWGTIDGIVNNAGITEDNLIARMKPDSFDKVININLKGTINGIKSV